MILKEVQQQTYSIDRMCTSYIRAMESVKKVVFDFVAEERLQGDIYDAAKIYFKQIYIPLAEGIILLSEAVKNAQQTFIERYMLEVDDNDLDADVLQSQWQRIKSHIASMESLHNANPHLYMDSTSIVSTFRLIQIKIEDKLRRLHSFDTTSPNIFSEADLIAADVKAGLTQLHHEQARNTKAKSFQTDHLDMTWADNIQRKKFSRDVNAIVQQHTHVDERTSEALLTLAKDYPDMDVPKNLVQYVQKNEDSPLIQIGTTMLHEVLEQAKSKEMLLLEFINVLFHHKGKGSAR